ncbi:Uncharacterized protein dnl_41580 [Desulfonema limicola]|uniref:DUF4351 domain-containing protein n=1 Tax=Desulfonema limicola TaxID=45656 RepID=A0A975GIC7_9BACT|nr:hypothetical protein [Desulfonema limicola]QTA81808.1 Uncharacterized protein dnl_41580 [Desulfonema limicola]
MNTKTNPKQDDFDSPWKEIIEQYFKEFIEFFFPEAYIDIDWERGYEFLDKELQQITKDAEETRRYVDKLARVWLKSGEEEWALIHADVQSQWEKAFSERMYIYNYRLFDKFRRHAASFAVLGDTGSKWKPDTYENSLWGCRIKFEFPVVKLADYRNKTEYLGKIDNPFAVVVLAHLKTQATAKNKGRRRAEKLTLIRLLYKKGYSKQDIINLFRFIDWIMHLPEKEEKLFWQELKNYEKEEKMRYVTTGERIGFKRGYKQGQQELMQELTQKGGQISLQKWFVSVSKLIAKKYKSDAELELTYMAGLDADDLSELNELIFDFQTLEQVHEWIDNRISSKENQDIQDC